MATSPGSWQAAARERAGWLAPALLAVFVTAVVMAVWEFRFVADAKRYDLLRSADPILYYLPMLEAAFTELRSGRLFLWNPHQMCGTPGLATGIVGFLYPLNLLHLLLPAKVAMEVLTIVHVILAALFTGLAARTVRIGWAGATVAGLGYALTFPLHSLYFPNGVAALAWLPLGVAAIERAVTGGDRRWLPVLTIAACMPWLASAPQSATYTWFAFGLCALAAILRRWWRLRSWTDAGVVGIRLLVAMIAALLLASPQILPTFELSMYSARGDEALPIDKLMPFASPSPVEALGRVVGPPREPYMYFVGAVSLSFAAAAFWARSGVTIFCVLVVLWGMAATLGASWYLETMSRLPVVGSYRIPGRSVFCATFAIALLAGLGTDTLFGSRTTRRSRVAASTAVAVAGAALALFRYPHPAWWVAAGVPLLAAAALLPRRALLTIALPCALVALLLTDLVGFTRNTALLPYDGVTMMRESSRWQVLEEVRKRAGLDRVVLGGSTTDRMNWSPKSSMIVGLYTVEDHEPLTIGAYADFFQFAASGTRDAGDGASTWSGELPPGYVHRLNPETRRFLNLLSVRYILVDALALLNPSFREFSRQLAPVALDLPQPDPLERVRVFADHSALPRAYVVHHAECMEHLDDRLARLRDLKFNPWRSVVLEGTCPRTPQPDGGASRTTITSYDAMEVSIDAESAEPGWLVLTDSWYPGWQVYVNGERKALLRANTVVRAVEIPAGASKVEFRYVPWSFYTGVIVSCATVVAWLGWVFLRRRSGSLRPMPSM